MVAALCDASNKLRASARQNTTTPATLGASGPVPDKHLLLCQTNRTAAPVTEDKQKLRCSPLTLSSSSPPAKTYLAAQTRKEVTEVPDEQRLRREFGTQRELPRGGCGDATNINGEGSKQTNAAARVESPGGFKRCRSQRNTFCKCVCWRGSSLLLQHMCYTRQV